MRLTTKFIKLELELTKSLLDNINLEVSRTAQDKIGNLMYRGHKKKLVFEEIELSSCPGLFIHSGTPSRHIVLYLHGGGYVTGHLDYAKGYGAVLSSDNDISVFCIGYRLAPENPFPAAVEDAYEAYRFLVENGYSEDRIILAGESAGGGLCYALCQKLKDEGEKLPLAAIVISPWMDLTQTGTSYEINEKRDPSMSKKRLDFFAEQYLNDNDPRHKYASPIYGDFSGLPTSLVFAGEDEILLDDSKRLVHRLKENGVDAELHVAEGMWHAYILYGLKENKEDNRKIKSFIRKVVNGQQSVAQA